MPLGGLLGAGISAAGGLVGGALGAGDRAAAREKQIQATSILEEISAAPDAARPLILEKYRQAGILTPDMEAYISAGPSAMEKVTTSGEGINAQKEALKQMLERSKTGMTATDRAALAQAQSQAATEQNAKQQQILQQFAQRGQGGAGAQLAAQLQAAQGGSNQASQNALDIMGRSQQQALQAAAQSGGLGAQLEGQQFGEASQKAQAADQMNRFNVQNQLAAQHSNVGARNQAQAANLANLQNIGNQNVNLANTEAARQRAGEQQNFNNQLNLARTKAGALSGQAQNLQASGDKTAQSWTDIGAGAGGILNKAFGNPSQEEKYGAGTQYDPNNNNRVKPGADLSEFNFNQGGQVPQDYTRGGHVGGYEEVPGDNPINDTVDAKLSPGEIVIPKSIAQTSLGDKLLNLLNHHHEIKTHLDAIEKKANKPKKPKMNDGGQVPSNYDLMSRSINERLNPPAPVKKHEETLEEKNERIREQAHKDFMDPSYGYSDGGEVEKDDKSEFDKAGKTISQSIDPNKLKQFHPFNQGGMVPEKGTVAYLEHLMSQLHGQKNYANGTVDELGGVVPEQYPAPIIDPSLAQQNFQQQEMPLPETRQPISLPEEDLADKELASKKTEESKKSADDEIEKSVAKEADDRKLASDESDNEEDDINETEPDSDSDDEMEQDLKPKTKSFDSSSEALKRAQDERRRGYDSTDMLKYGNLIGAGASQSKALPESFFSSLNKGSQHAVESYKEQIANQQNDPNSEMSKVMRDYLKTKGMNISDSASASDLLKVAPFLSKDAALQNALEKVLIQQKGKAAEGDKTREQKASENEKNRKSGEKRAQILADARTKGYEKSDARQDQRLAGQVVQRIHQDPVIKPSEQNMASLAKSKAILENEAVPLTPQLLADAEQDIASALTIRGLGGTEGKIKRSELITLNRKIAEAKQKWLNQPDIDLRKEDPALIKQIYKTNKALYDDYALTIKDRKHEIAKEFQPMAENSPRIQKTIDQYLKTTDSGKVVVEKDGKRFKLPISQLEQAKSQGYTQVE